MQRQLHEGNEDVCLDEQVLHGYNELRDLLKEAKDQQESCWTACLELCLKMIPSATRSTSSS